MSQSEAKNNPCVSVSGENNLCVSVERGWDPAATTAVIPTFLSPTEEYCTGTDTSIFECN